jgi:hypothetical protein
MIRDKSSREEAIESVLAGLQALILMSAKRAAGEQYSPSSDPDASDDLIADRKIDMAKLRSLRVQFENLATGVIENPRCWAVQTFFSSQREADEALKELSERFPQAFVSSREIW